ncbi:uncharacterized protein LOC126898271 [Daktulosphaira vitifoliae]|uniref:uncharacterized protein LOC126898271 n=1 Tax=Daktulosphaira vitifoliae TaxID=58002 RepID=UPI0021AAC5C8|nr:uncharacterized protein LOC126898271 [Daktulosphaira vitifoliae]
MNVIMQFVLAIVLFLPVSSVPQVLNTVISPYGVLKLVEKRRVLNEKHLLFLNKLFKTEDNELIFLENDIRLLNSRQKETLREKYNKRIEFLHCQNSCILKYIERKIIDDLLLIDGKPDPKKIKGFKVYKTYVENMLSILFYNHIKANNWIFSIYMKLLAVVKENNIVLNKFFFSRIKMTIEKYKNNVMNIYSNGMWAIEPHVFLELHWRIQHIIYTHFLLHIAFHLNAFWNESGINVIVETESFVSVIQEQYKNVNVKELWQSLVAEDEKDK